MDTGKNTDFDIQGPDFVQFAAIGALGFIFDVLANSLVEKFFNDERNLRFKLVVNRFIKLLNMRSIRIQKLLMKKFY